MKIKYYKILKKNTFNNSTFNHNDKQQHFISLYLSQMMLLRDEYEILRKNDRSYNFLMKES